ncbi:unnamed protein product [Fusarium equiseti]|uniref:Uncharacterized protein n=1 Tax=Fusarium equiseti TaxID=61235 RepID=A0A8J2IW63_FUSEQ|nr:unnamed protein product [Fusarium equiseti]
MWFARRPFLLMINTCQVPSFQQPIYYVNGHWGERNWIESPFNKPENENIILRCKSQDATQLAGVSEYHLQLSMAIGHTTFWKKEVYRQSRLLCLERHDIGGPANLPSLRNDLQRSEVQNIPIVSGGPASGSGLPSLSGAVEVTNGVYTDEESDSGSLLPASHLACLVVGLSDDGDWTTSKVDAMNTSTSRVPNFDTDEQHILVLVLRLYLIIISGRRGRSLEGKQTNTPSSRVQKGKASEENNPGGRSIRPKQYHVQAILAQRRHKNRKLQFKISRPVHSPSEPTRKNLSFLGDR